MRLRQAEADLPAGGQPADREGGQCPLRGARAYQAYRATYDIARHYRREVLPLRKIISDETLLRYNAMQIDVFALLTEARQRIAATTAAIEAQRDFWLAETNLGAAVIGGAAAAASEAPAPRRRRREAPAATERGDRS